MDKKEELALQRNLVKLFDIENDEIIKNEFEYLISSLHQIKFNEEFKIIYFYLLKYRTQLK